MNCVDVETRLDLYAANECNATEAEAIRRHLPHCPRCTAVYQAAQESIALLDLHFQEPERLRRLSNRLDRDEEPRRMLRFPGKMRHLASLAAMLLLTTTLALGLAPRFGNSGGDGGLSVTLAPVRFRGAPEADVVRAPKELLAQTQHARLDFQGQTPEQYREELREREQTGRLPKPPEVDLTLDVENTTGRELQVWINGPQTELRLDLHGPGAIALNSVQATESRPQSITLAPGEHYSLRIVRLEEHAPWKPHFWYWTAPGTYSLTARLTTTVASPGSGSRRVTIRSAPVTIQVEP
jgi:hypothetical protein